MSTLKLTILSDPSKFRAGIEKASKELRGLQATTKSVSEGMSKALGAIGLGMGIKAIAGFLKDSAHAAAEDSKSQALLATTLQNTVGATKGAISATEAWLDKTSNAVAILDDDLRPALATAVRATGSLSKGQKLLTLALDVSAGTGKDLSSVSIALGKAYNGNIASLKRYGINIKDVNNWQQELTDKFKGSAEAAANADPFQKLNVIFDNLKETVGYALLPDLQKFGEYLSSPAGVAQVRQIANTFVQMAKAVGSVVSFVIQNIGLFKTLALVIIEVKVAIGLMTFAMKVYDLATKLAAISTKGLKYALIGTGIGAVLVALGSVLEIIMAISDTTVDATQNAQDLQNQMESLYSPEMKAAIDNFKGDILEIDEALGQVWGDGKLIFDQSAADSVAQQAADAADAVKKEIEKRVSDMAKTGEKFRDAVGLAFGLRGKDERSIFDVKRVTSKMRALIDAAKGFGANLKKLAKVPGWSQSNSAELIAMGPAAGNIAAKSLLSNTSDLKEFVKLSGQLYTIGAGAQAQTAITGNASYEININKADVKAADIIREIRKYEKKTGRKYLN